MSFVLRAAIGSVALAIVAVPAAQAAKAPDKRGLLSVRSVGSAPATVQAGKTFNLTARVANARNRRAASGRLTLSLRPSSGAKQRLDGFNVKRLKGGNVRTLRMKVLVGAKVPAGSYKLVACVRRGSGEDKGSCRTIRQLSITAAPATTPAAAAPSPQAAGAPQVSAALLPQVVNSPGMAAHLRAFQAVADSNGGNRASGLQGYGGTTEYVLTTLRAAGYQPTVQTFDFLFFRQLADSIFVRNTPEPAKTYVEGEEFLIMSYSGTGDVTAPVIAVDVNLEDTRANTSGCEAADFDGFPRGAIALMQRGTCAFGDKAANAEAAGAGAAIIFNQGNTDAEDRNNVLNGTLGQPVTIPAIGIDYAEGAALASAENAQARVKTSTQVDTRTTANILAETAGGDPTKVVLVGSHLDSVPEGPGINDNGTGSAFNLELALQLAKLPAPANKVRFAWWGAEEEGLLGSTQYVAEISEADFANIQLNLNFDMLGSPNHAKLVYDGDFSDSPPPATAPDVNPGAALIEQAFVKYFSDRGMATEPTGFDGRSDYKAFQDNGVPAGGLFTGAEVPKTEAQAAKWGGIPSRPFDPNYHEAGDTIDNIDFAAYEQMADAAAYVTGLYATQALPANAGGGMKAPSAAKVQRQVAQSERLGSKLQR